jgi:hypothetical protein
MAEIGLVKFAQIALQLGQAALPACRSKFSKRRFQQPQLLAILCLMRYADWTFREAEVRLAEHAELRAALGLQHVPDFTTAYRFLHRLDEAALVDHHDEYDTMVSPQLRWTSRRGDRGPRRDLS